jgi:DNA-directed RNA polymerase subunit K/omega
MNALLLTTALKTIPNPQMLVNVVRLRVKQLALGHRPLVMAAPGTGLADVALAEIIEQKLSFELTPEIRAIADGSAAPAVVLPFPTTPPAKVKKAA